MNKTITIERSAGNTYIGDSPEYKVDAAINELLNLLASQPFSFARVKRKPSARTVVKIKYNNIQTKRYIIKQYLDRSSAIEIAYLEINSIIPFGKDIILQSLNDLYCSALDDVGIEYLNQDIDIYAIRENSEYILDYIITKLRNSALEAKNTPNLKEQIEAGVNIVVAHAFIECVIMENPDSDS